MTIPTEPWAGAADTPPAPSAFKPCKIYRNEDTGRFGFQCRVCPDAPSIGGFLTAADAAQCWLDAHVPSPDHQRHLTHG